MTLSLMYLESTLKKLKLFFLKETVIAKSGKKKLQNADLATTKLHLLHLKQKFLNKSLALFEELGVMNHVEAEARYEIELEEYTKKIQIEGRVLGDIARNHVVPTAIRYQNVLIENVKGLKEIFGRDFENVAKEQIILIKEISGHIAAINSKVEEMTEARKKANSLDTTEKMADAYCDNCKTIL